MTEGDVHYWHRKTVAELFVFETRAALVTTETRAGSWWEAAKSLCRQRRMRSAVHMGDIATLRRRAQDAETERDKWKERASRAEADATDYYDRCRPPLRQLGQ